MPARLRPRTKTRYQIAQDDAAREAIRRAIDAAGGKLQSAAALLDISRTTLYREMRRLGLDQEPTYETVA